MHPIPSHEVLDQEVARRFGFQGFRPGQRALVEAVLGGRDALGVMPTGGGKSLCFQLPAALLKGTALVISPLIALMKDQVDALRARGIHAEAYNSSMSAHERRRAEDAIQSGKLNLLYMAPERIQAEDFMGRLAQLPLSLLAIDEAHCISHWGHDFRPDYRRLGELRSKVRGVDPALPVPVIALTATATQRVQADIVERLHMRNPAQIITGFRRTNLAFEVKKMPSRAAKLRTLRELTAQAIEQGGSAVIYAATRKNVELVAEEISAKTGGPNKELVGFYHAGLSDEERTQVQEDFLRDKKRVLIATNAFGMGIDKATVRLVAHYEIPGSVEAYYQEAGRAGRDGKPARCVLLFNYADVATQEFFIKKNAQEFQDSESGRDQDALLKQLVRYAYGSQCRQQLMLGYFGDPEAREFEGCGICDFCRPEKRKKAPADEMMTLASRQILSAVARLNGRFGKNRICDMLKGSVTEAFLKSGLQRQSTYGLLSGWSLDSIRELVDLLMEAGYLRISGLEYPVLHLTTEGLKAMKGEVPVSLPVVEEEIEEPAENGRSKRRKGKKMKPSASAGRDSVTDAHLGLLESLKAFRREEAKAKSLPPYVIFHDKTLEAIAAEKPQSLRALEGIPGLGPKKIELYGEKVLSVIHSKQTQKQAP